MNAGSNHRREKQNIMTEALQTVSGKHPVVALYLDKELISWGSPPPSETLQEIIEVGIVARDLNKLATIHVVSYFVWQRRWDISLMWTRLMGTADKDIRRAKPLGCAWNYNGMIPAARRTLCLLV